LIVICLLFFIVYRAFELASKTSSYFYKLVCVGVASYIGSQTFVNLGGISGTIPLTGVPLPFISFGGSSMISLSIAMGLLLITAKQMKVDESKRRQQRKHTKNFSVLNNNYFVQNKLMIQYANVGKVCLFFYLYKLLLKKLISVTLLISLSYQ